MNFFFNFKRKNLFIVNILELEFYITLNQRLPFSNKIQKNHLKFYFSEKVISFPKLFPNTQLEQFF